jgi:antitoxin component of MazEF toxin-antitoxin module
MTQKLLQIGSSAGVTIPKKSLKDLGLTIGDEVEVEIYKARRMVSIKPVEHLSREDKRIAELTMKFINRYRKDLEALAQK